MRDTVALSKSTMPVIDVQQGWRELTSVASKDEFRMAVYCRLAELISEMGERFKVELQESEGPKALKGVLLPDMLGDPDPEVEGDGENPIATKALHQAAGLWFNHILTLEYRQSSVNREYVGLPKKFSDWLRAADHSSAIDKHYWQSEEAKDCNEWCYYELHDFWWFASGFFSTASLKTPAVSLQHLSPSKAGAKTRAGNKAKVQENTTTAPTTTKPVIGEPTAQATAQRDKHMQGNVPHMLHNVTVNAEPAAPEAIPSEDTALRTAEHTLEAANTNLFELTAKLQQYLNATTEPDMAQRSQLQRDVNQASRQVARCERTVNKLLEEAEEKLDNLSEHPESVSEVPDPAPTDGGNLPQMPEAEEEIGMHISEHSGR